MTPTPDDIRKATQLACVLSANFDRHVQQIAQALAEEREAERERCAGIADRGMLAPPDGGSPTPDEIAVAQSIAAAIRRSEP